MGSVLNDWNIFLQLNGTAIGLILALCGGSLLASGWRFERAALILIFGFAGGTFGAVIAGEMSGVIASSVMCTVGAIALGVLLKQFAAPVLAGIVGVMALRAMIGETHMPTATLYILLVLAFIAIGIPAMANSRNATIVLTSFAGAAMVVSGIVAIVADSQAMSRHFEAMALYRMFYPFLLVVPTVMGIFLQLSAANHKDVGDVCA